MTGTTRPRPHQAHSAHCGAVIPTGTTKPRTYCSDRCRKAETRFRTGGSLPYRAQNSNAPAAKFERFRTRKPNEIKGQIPAKNGPSTAINLIDGERTGGLLDRRLVAKILSAEIGTPTANITSPDGVIATIPIKRGGS